jgi:hypothetical protein
MNLQFHYSSSQSIVGSMSKSLWGRLGLVVGTRKAIKKANIKREHNRLCRVYSHSIARIYATACPCGKRKPAGFSVRIHAVRRESKTYCIAKQKKTPVFRTISMPSVRSLKECGYHRTPHVEASRKRSESTQPVRRRGKKLKENIWC